MNKKKLDFQKQLKIMMVYQNGKIFKLKKDFILAKTGLFLMKKIPNLLVFIIISYSSKKLELT